MNVYEIPNEVSKKILDAMISAYIDSSERDQKQFRYAGYLFTVHALDKNIPSADYFTSVDGEYIRVDWDKISGFEWDTLILRIVADNPEEIAIKLGLCIT